MTPALRPLPKAALALLLATAAAAQTPEALRQAGAAYFDGASAVSQEAAPTVPGRSDSRISLGELAQELSGDPKAVDALFSELTKRSGDLARVFDDEARRERLRQALESSDKSFLDSFPVLTPGELAAAAGYLASRQKPAADLPAPSLTIEKLELPGGPRDPKPGAFMTDLGHGLWHGDKTLAGQGSAYGDNEKLSYYLNRLADNSMNDPSYTLLYEGKKVHSADDLFAAFLEEGDSVVIADTRHFAQFGGLWYRHGGHMQEVMTPVYVDTGIKLPSGNDLIVPAVHSMLDITVRGRVNADLEFYFGFDGSAAFRPHDIVEKTWVGGRAVRSWSGLDTLLIVAKAAEVRRGLERKAKEGGLPLGGYGPLGVCNDADAMITNDPSYPLIRDPKDYQGSTNMDVFSASIPYDLTQKPDPQRVLDSMPLSDPRDIPFPVSRDGLLELLGPGTAHP